MREAPSFCRVCAVMCGVCVKIDDADRIVAIRGDKANPLTAGFACGKGVDAAAMYSRPDRLLHPLKRDTDGVLRPTTLDIATAEIAQRLDALIAQHGAESVAMYCGTAGFLSAPLSKITAPFMRAIGSPSMFSSLTIDNSAKFVSAARLGSWGAGRESWETANVWMMFGCNPLVSNTQISGMPVFNVTRQIKAAKARGLQLILIDPRRTETARYADMFVQPRPGEDIAIIAGMLRIILTEGLHDAAFCAEYVDGLETLRRAVAPFSDEVVAARAGITALQLHAMAHAFAGPGRRGCAIGATGITMAPFSNLAQHLVDLLNVVCGRFARAGQPVANPLPGGPRRTVRAEVVRPPRWWTTGHTLRTGGYGMLHTEEGGELPTTALPDEILLPGKGQIKALICVGGNPAAAFPDQDKTVRALRALDLLVTLEPLMTNTARLSHYVIAPRLMYERADLPLLYGQATRVNIPFAQYTPALVPPPPASEVAEEWLFLWDLASRMGRQIILCGRPLDMRTPPSTDEMLELITAGAQVPLADIKRYPSGHVYQLTQAVEQASPDNHNRFDAMPDDVGAELVSYMAAPVQHDGYPYRLLVRRMRGAMNSLVGAPHRSGCDSGCNPAYINDTDMATLGLRTGDRVAITSHAARVLAVAEADNTQASGTVSMAQCWGRLPEEDGDPAQGGTSSARLVSNVFWSEPINAMAAMTAIPVRLEAASGPAPRPGAPAAPSADADPSQAAAGP